MGAALRFTVGAQSTASAAEPDAANATNTTNTTLPSVATSDARSWRKGRPENGYWSVGEPRWFISTKSDIGGLYLKPYFSFGYGLPHWIWTGVDVNSNTTLEFTQVYFGIRGSTPVFDLAMGVGDACSFWKTYLEPRPSYVQADPATRRAPQA